MSTIVMNMALIPNIRASVLSVRMMDVYFALRILTNV